MEGNDTGVPVVIPFDRIKKLLPYNSGEYYNISIYHCVTSNLHLSSFIFPPDPFKDMKPSDSLKKELAKEFSNESTILTQGLVAVTYIVGNILSDVIWQVNDFTQACDIHLSIKSHGLPIGAGLGSSAAFSVAVTGACLKVLNNINGVVDAVKEWEVPDEKMLAIINGWAFAAEILNHGSPSGLDNTTSCYGGMMKFSKTSDGQQTFQKISRNPSLHILLTNTKVPRSTKVLVANVKELREKVPHVIDPIFSTIDIISNRFIEIVEGEDYDNNRSIHHKEISSLVNINHKLLVSLGVSHPSLDLIYTESLQAGFSCKLTGAGGGGCAFTLGPFSPDSSNESEVKDEDEYAVALDRSTALTELLR